MLTALALHALLASPAAPQSTLPPVERRRLNGPLAQGPLSGQARLESLSPDGTRILFRQLIGARTYLCVAEVDGSSPALPLDEVVPVLPRWSPDGEHVIYGEWLASGYALLSVRSDGSTAPVMLFTPSATDAIEGWPPFTGVPDASLAFSPDGSRVGLRTRRNGSLDLLSIPIEGGASVVLDTPVIYLLASALGDDFVYLRDRTWFKVSAAGGTPLQIGHTPSASESPVIFPMSPFVVPAAGRLVYVTGQDNVQIWSAPLDGSSAAVRLVLQSFQLNHIDMRAAPDGSRLLFARTSFAADEFLQAVPLDGSSAPVVIATTTTGGVGPFSISPDSQRVLYKDDVSQVLASVALDGTAPLTHGVFDSVDERFTPDSQRVLVQVPVGLQSFAADGSDLPLTVVALPPGRSLSRFEATADSAQVVFLAELDQQFLSELYRVPAAAVAAPVKLHAPLAPGVELNSFLVTPDSAHALADYQILAGNLGALTRSALSGPPDEFHLELPATIGTVGDVLGFDVQQGRAIWIAHGDSVGVQELYGATVAGSAPVKLNAALVPGGDVLLARLTPDGRRALYLADGDVDELTELYSVPSDGSGPAVKLSAEGQDLDFDFVRVSPDSTRVVYRTAAGILRSTALTGGPVTSLGAGGSELAITADSAFVVDLAPGTSLRSTPIGGGAPALLVSADIEDFRLSPDGQTIAYRLSVPAQDQLSLWVVPVAGGTPLQLSGTLVTGGQVREYAFAGTRLVFRADLATDERYLLCSVRLDGSESRRVLNGTLAAGGDVLGFQLSDDGTRAVYLADQVVDGVENLHRVPVDGSSADVRLQTTDLDEVAFELVLDDRRVVYMAPGAELRSIRTSGGSSTLLGTGFVRWSVTADGERVIGLRGQRLESLPVRGGAPTLLAEPAEPLFLDFELDGPAVLFLEQDEDDVTELWSLTFRPRARRN